jgi:hypothetical protein
MGQTPPAKFRKAEGIHCAGWGRTSVDAWRLIFGLGRGTEAEGFGTGGAFFGAKGEAVARSSRAKATL